LSNACTIFAPFSVPFNNHSQANTCAVSHTNFVVLYTPLSSFAPIDFHDVSSTSAKYEFNKAFTLSSSAHSFFAVHHTAFAAFSAKNLGNHTALSYAQPTTFSTCCHAFCNNVGFSANQFTYNSSLLFQFKYCSISLSQFGVVDTK
jgi:hypothetical protein